MGVEEGGREQQTQGYIDCDRLTALKHLAIRHPLRDEVFFVEKGQERVAQDQQFRESYKEGRKRQKEPNKSSSLLHSSDHGKAEAASKKATQTHTLNAMKKDLVETLSRMDSESGSATGIGIEDMTDANAMPSSTLLSSSILAGTRIGSSASSKLNYLLADVCACGHLGQNKALNLLHTDPTPFFLGEISRLLRFPLNSGACCRGSGASWNQVLKIHHSNSS